MWWGWGYHVNIFIRHCESTPVVMAFLLQELPVGAEMKMAICGSYIGLSSNPYSTVLETLVHEWIGGFLPLACSVRFHWP